ncbi:MAG: hydrogenase expression/formation protein HypE [Planctomycetes bacterium]|nr:hydrogenase expression/formation protein HypE [Planctomycetota bacterium]MCP4772081.1 hydrogenase expression/formation protein HypE [Planctomycetota bacterium]MCP4860798.1 hydrogenase expression/formation protein HypE [Planctomycetota bacterium]
MKNILLAHGSGGRLTGELIRKAFVPAFENPGLNELSDSALLPNLPEGQVAFSTDGFVVEPTVFPGGNLGEISVCGTVNDLAVAGARPLWLSWALILEEGLPMEKLQIYVDGAKAAAAQAGVQIVCGDTKVVPRGKGDEAFVVTAGIGVVPPERKLSDKNIEVGDALIVSGTVGDHGATILACRHDISGLELKSDCGPVNRLTEALFDADVDVRVMHDPTRGGVATTCNEAADRSGHRLVIDAADVPVSTATRAVCELLGMDPLYLACEGRVLAWVPADQVDQALAAWHALPEGEGAVRLGTIHERTQGTVPVSLRTAFGGEQPVDVLSGMDLPRIC